jgi:4-hydroxy-tetrahydrodipicolinate synthase
VCVQKGRIIRDFLNNLFKEDVDVDFGRLMTAMVTAFTADGKIDFESQTKIIEHLIATGTETIIVSGTTGESPTLSREEKLQLFKHTVQTVNGRAKVMAGTGSNNTEDTVTLTAKAAEQGVDGIMLVTPYYNRPNQEGLYRHFRSAAESMSLPVMLYNVPGRTSCNLLPETICRLAELPNITMVKEASEHLGQMTRILKETPDDFLLFSGDDSLTLPVLAVGGHGVVSVASHVIGAQIKQMLDDFLTGRVNDAALKHQNLYGLMKALFNAPSPVPVKRILAEMGLCSPHVRLPLVVLAPDEEKELLRHFSAFV